jgi:dsDNA-binding SOS-regulon protein
LLEVREPDPVDLKLFKLVRAENKRMMKAEARAYEKMIDFTQPFPQKPRPR